MLVDVSECREIQDVVSSCTKKNRYETRLKAKRVATARMIETGQKLYVYRCRYCGGWHISKRRRQRSVHNRTNDLHIM